MDVNTLVDLILASWLLGSFVFLAIVEEYTGIRHIPTISERVQKLAGAVPLVRFLGVGVGITMLIHFFAQGL